MAISCEAHLNEADCQDNVHHANPDVECQWVCGLCAPADKYFPNVEDAASAKVTGEGWAEIRPLDEGAESFQDIHDGRAAPKIILAMS